MSKRARPKRTGDIDTYHSKLKELISGSNDIGSRPFRAQIQAIGSLYQAARDLGVAAAIAHGYHQTSGMERILEYFKEHVGQTIAGTELEVVSGISEYGRRIRQLRVEGGYRIYTGASSDPETGLDLRPDEYVLTSLEADHDSARRWKLANGIRRRSGGSREKILEFLKANVGVVVTTEELAYVSNDKREFARRTRELRTQDGFAIATRFTGRPDLRSGEYVLLSVERIAEPHDRHIPHEVQKKIYDRDQSTCRLCGWNINAWRREDPRILELQHVEHHAHGGANRPDNLLTICSRCHDEIHAGRLKIPTELLKSISP